DLGPFAGATIVLQRETRTEHEAVNRPRSHHSELAARRARHRLVKQRETSFDRTTPRQDATFVREPQRRQLGIAVAVTERPHATRELEHAVPVPGGDA